jgi:HJR/Mrr/RecB family endonuclease
MLESYKKKFAEEKELYKKKAEELKKKMEEAEKEFKSLLQNIDKYKWTEDEKEYLRNMKGIEFERTFSIMFELLGFKVLEPVIYKDHNIDIILDLDNKKICVDFLDYTQRKKLNENYIKTLLKGKEKYNCHSVWLITNRFLDDDIESMIYKYDINLFEFNQIVRFFPSYRVVDEYDENRTKYHNFELLHKETADEVIRRELWIKEIEEKLAEAKRKRAEV